MLNRIPAFAGTKGANMDPSLDASGLFSRLGAWAQKPLNSNMDLVGLALTVIFVATVVFLYHRFLAYIAPTV